jgi:hypothetical protein
VGRQVQVTDILEWVTSPPSLALTCGRVDRIKILGLSRGKLPDWTLG